MCDKEEREDLCRYRKVGELHRGNMRKFLSVVLLLSYWVRKDDFFFKRIVKEGE